MLSPPDVLARTKAATGAELGSGSYEKNANLFKHLPVPVKLKEKFLELGNSTNEVGRNQHGGSSVNPGDNRNYVQDEKDGYVPALPQGSFAMLQQSRVGNINFLYPVCYCSLVKFHDFVILLKLVNFLYI